MFAQLSFIQAMIVAGLALTALFIGLVDPRRRQVGDTLPLGAVWAHLLVPVSLGALLLTLLVSLTLEGPRGLGWFVLQITTLTLLGLLALTGRQRALVIGGCAALITVTGMAILQAQHTGGTNEDQWRDLAAAHDVLTYGNLDRARGVMGGYYSVVPALPILIPLVSGITGLDLFDANLVVAPLFTFMGSLALLMLTERMTGFIGAPVVATVMILAGPRLAIWLLLHQSASTNLAAITLLLLYTAYLWKDHLWSEGASRCILLLVFVLNATHPSGTIAILLFMLATVASFPVARLLFGTTPAALGTTPPELWRAREQRLRWLLVTIGIMVTSYWLFTQLLDYLSRNYVSAFVLQFYRPPVEVYRVQMNQVSGDRVAALAWALPVALTLTYLVWVGLPLLHRSLPRLTTPAQMQGAALGIAGLTALLAGFGSSLVRGSEGSFERYLSVPSYLLMLAPAVAATRLIGARGNLALLIVSTVLITTASTSSRSMEWAPDIHEHAGLSRRSDTVIGHRLAEILPSDGRFAAIKQIDSVLMYEIYIKGYAWGFYHQAEEYMLTIGLMRDVGQGISAPPKPVGEPAFVIVGADWLKRVTVPIGTDLIYWGGDTVVLVPPAH